jgi:hypothetical protein
MSTAYERLVRHHMQRATTLSQVTPLLVDPRLNHKGGIVHSTIYGKPANTAWSIELDFRVAHGCLFARPGLVDQTAVDAVTQAA